MNNLKTNRFRHTKKFGMQGSTTWALGSVVIVSLFSWLCLAITFEELEQGHSYLTLYNIAATECRDACDRRMKCKGTLYIHRRQSCELLDVDMTAITSVPETDQRAALYKKLKPTPSCGNMVCTERQLCLNDTCQFQECERISVNNDTIVKGNMVNVGNRVKVACPPGYIQSDGTMATSTHVCGKNGEWEPAIKNCILASCMVIGQKTNVSAEYLSFDDGKLVKMWCDFEQDHGYVYIARDSIADVTNISRYFTRSDHVMIRHVLSTDIQYIGKMQLLQMYMDEGNITVLANEHNGFDGPADINSGTPYIYLHLLPEPFNNNTLKVEQGYRFQNEDVTFTNIYVRNYLITHANVDINLPQWEWDCANRQHITWQPGDVTCEWVDKADQVDTTRYINNTYFCKYSMHMGGHGTYLHKLKRQTGDVTGVAFGFRFDL